MSLMRRLKRALGYQRLARELLPAHRVLVGTHHKTGTVWLFNIFKEIAEQTGLRIFSGDAATLSAQNDIFFQDHSCFSDTLSGVGEYRGLHVIRDPRDVVISGLFYHKKSSESWLHTPKPEFGGQSYQQKLNSIQSLDEQIDFELQNAAYRCTREMAGWDYGNPDFIEIKYEDLIKDTGLKMFHDIFVFLGFSGKAIPMCLEIAYSKSLFSGQVKNSLHVRSGKGSQWKKYFKKAHRRRFIDLHGDVLVRLGYETDSGWVERDIEKESAG